MLLIWLLERSLLDLDPYKCELGQYSLPLNLRSHLTPKLRFLDWWLKARAEARLWLFMIEQRFLAETRGCHEKKQTLWNGRTVFSYPLALAAEG